MSKSAQTAAVDALKWALVAFKVEIDALDLLKRTKADASVILAFRMTFNNYSCLRLQGLKLIIKPSNNSRISLISLNTIKGLYRHIKQKRLSRLMRHLG
jgi:hypothetical protein